MGLLVSGGCPGTRCHISSKHPANRYRWQIPYPGALANTLRCRSIFPNADRYLEILIDIRKDLRILANELESLKPSSTVSSSVERHVKRYRKRSGRFKVLGGTGSVDGGGISHRPTHAPKT